MFNALESRLRETNNPKDKEIADTIGSLCRIRGEDIFTREAEPKTEIRQFSPEAHEELTKRGYVISTLTGKSIRDLDQEGKLDPEHWNINSYPATAENIPSRKSEVATLPNIFIPESSNQTFEAQFGKISLMFVEPKTKIEGTLVTIGSLPDYAELFSSKIDLKENVYIRTTTPDHGFYTIIGRRNDDRKIEFGIAHPNSTQYDLLAAPIFVPA